MTHPHQHHFDKYQTALNDLDSLNGISDATAVAIHKALDTHGLAVLASGTAATGGPGADLVSAVSASQIAQGQLIGTLDATKPAQLSAGNAIINAYGHILVATTAGAA